MGCCNGRKLQKSWFLIPSQWVYNDLYGSTQFSLRENYKCSLWTFPLRSVRVRYKSVLKSKLPHGIILFQRQRQVSSIILPCKEIKKKIKRISLLIRNDTILLARRRITCIKSTRIFSSFCEKSGRLHVAQILLEKMCGGDQRTWLVGSLLMPG